MIAALVGALVCATLPPSLPVQGRVTDWFRKPACTWCPGNRGLEFSTAFGSPVVSPWPGSVDFVGSVGGVPYVVVLVDREMAGITGATDNVYSVIGGLEPENLEKGQKLTNGTPLGVSQGWLYVGFREGPRRDARYLDPAPLFRLAPRRAVLVAEGRRSSSLSLASSPNHQSFGRQAVARNTTSTRHCTVSPPVVASARGPVS